MRARFTPPLRWTQLATLVASGWLAGCASAPKGPPEPYLRVARPSEDTVQLQVAARKFVPVHGRSPAIWLVGASHIGETNYYAGLQRQLDGCTVVLYEGVGDQARRKRTPRARVLTNAPSVTRTEGTNSTGEASNETGLQGTMARSLGLVFQLDSINYDRTNFFNSDLTIVEIQALMQPGAKPARTRPSSSSRRKLSAEDEEENNAFRDLLKAMDGSSAYGALMQGLMKFIGSSTKLQAMTKLTLIEVLGAIRADPTRLQGVPPDMKKLLEVLIRERNKVVVQDLKTELKRARPKDSIAVFYGAGHLPDLEERVRRELRYRPAEDVWHAAFSVNTVQAGLSEFELSFLRSFIRSQLGALTK